MNGFYEMLVSITVVVLTESRAEGIPQQLSEGIRLAENKFKGEMKFNMEVVPLFRERESESYNRGT